MTEEAGAKVNLRLRFPMWGIDWQQDKVISQLIKDFKIRNAVAQYAGLELWIDLAGGDLSPVRLYQLPPGFHKGNGRKYYVTRKEAKMLANCNIA